MTVSQIDREMTAKELTEWMVFYSIEPFGPAREDYRAALQASITANAAGAKVQPDEIIKPWSFQEEQRARQDALDEDKFNAQQEAQIAMMRSMMGASKNG